MQNKERIQEKNAFDTTKDDKVKNKMKKEAEITQ